MAAIIQAEAEGARSLFGVAVIGEVEAAPGEAAVPGVADSPVEAVRLAAAARVEAGNGENDHSS